MKGFFLGAFGVADSERFRGSAAGAKVQLEIVEALSEQLESLSSFIMPEMPSWPKDSLIVKAKSSGLVKFVPFINFKLVKRPWFFIVVFLYFLRQRPAVIFQYNSSISGVVFSILTRLFLCKSVLILQDLNAPVSLTLHDLLSPSKIIGYLYAKLLPYGFDWYVPITKACVQDLRLPVHRCMVFQGAALRASVCAARRSSQQDSECTAVFAGALEKYNGIDLLVEKWPTPEQVKCRLNVFGRGSLETYVNTLSLQNSNVIFHGFQSPDVIDDYVSRASFNFCLRYSKGIEQEYFFPSKFFDLVLFRGALVCNEFRNIPADLTKYVTFVDEDLEKLIDVISQTSSLSSFSFAEKVNYLEHNYTWFAFFSRFFSRFIA